MFGLLDTVGGLSFINYREISATVIEYPSLGIKATLITLKKDESLSTDLRFLQLKASLDLLKDKKSPFVLPVYSIIEKETCISFITESLKPLTLKDELPGLLKAAGSDKAKKEKVRFDAFLNS